LVTVTTSYQALTNGNNQVTRTVSGSSPVITTVTEIDPFGQVVRVTAPNGDVTTSTYDGMGRLTLAQMTPASGGTSQSRNFTYDTLGRLLVAVEPESGTQAFSNFNALNLAQTVTENSSRTQSRTYDGLGRLRIHIRGGVYETYTYEGAFLTGTSRTVNGNQINQNFQYHGAGARLSQETTSGSVTGSW
jgi:YD repeat-containing protein